MPLHPRHHRLEHRHWVNWTWWDLRLFGLNWCGAQGLHWGHHSLLRDQCVGQHRGMGILHHLMVDHLLRRPEIGAHGCGWKHDHGSHVCTKTTKTGSSKLQFEPDWLRCQETLLMSTFISCADEFHTLLKDSKRSKAHCPMRLHAPPFVSDRNTQDYNYKLRHGSVSLCILLYGSPSSHKEDTVAQEITTQTFPQETAALPGCSPTDNRWGVWHEFVVKKLPYQNWVLLFYSSCSSKHWVLSLRQTNDIWSR